MISTWQSATIGELPNLGAIVGRLNEELSTYTDFYRLHPTLSPGAADIHTAAGVAGASE